MQYFFDQIVCQYEFGVRQLVKLQIYCVLFDVDQYFFVFNICKYVFEVFLIVDQFVGFYFGFIVFKGVKVFQVCQRMVDVGVINFKCVIIFNWIFDVQNGVDCIVDLCVVIDFDVVFGFFCYDL